MFVVVFILIALHGLDGREIDISAEEITSLQCKIPGVTNKLFAEGANAIINLTDGRYVTVVETCSEVRDAIAKAQEGDR